MRAIDRSGREKMASTSALQRKGGVAERIRRRRNEKERATSVVYEGASADDELTKLMPALKRRFEAFHDHEGTLNCMGELNKSNETSFRRNDDKENVFPDRNSFRQSQMRRGSGRVTISRHIDFDKLLKTVVPPPSSSLYKNITTVLKEKVNKTELQSQNVEDFWSTEMQKKISAVTRRKQAGIKTPAQTIPKPAEDRYARHARSRRGGGNSRNLPGKSSIKLDAANISEWDQGTLVEEEGTRSTRANCGALLSEGRRPTLQGNCADLDRGRKEIVLQQGALGAARRIDEIQDEGYKPNVPSLAPSKEDLRSSLPDMDLTLMGVRDFFGRGKHVTDPSQASASCYPDLIMEEFFSNEPTVPDRIELEDSDDMETTGQNLPSGCVREDHGSHPQEISMKDLPPRDSHLEEKPLVTPCKGFPILDCSNLHRQSIPATSPTPPSNPVAVYMSSRQFDEDFRQRRLAFLTSPWSKTTEGRRDQKSDFKDVQPVGDLCPEMEQFQKRITDELQDEKCVLEGFESRADVCNFERDKVFTSKGDVEGSRMVFGEGELLRDLCNLREHQRTASKFDLQTRDLREESLSVASCDKSILRVDDEVRTQKAGQAEIGQVRSQEKLLHCSVQCDDNKSRQDQIFITKACDPSLGENALEAIFHNFASDDENDLVMPDVKETEPVPNECNAKSLAEQTEPNILAPNHEASLDEVPLENKAQFLFEKLNGTRYNETLAAQKNAPADGAIAKDERGTTQTGPKRSKRKRTTKLDNRRSSLKDSGSTWTNGQRRSQRRRVRPLEWWRGEKLLYGRVHKDLTTVIGIKHSSLGKSTCGIKSPFVVESYLPTQYSELVRFAAI